MAKIGCSWLNIDFLFLAYWGQSLLLCQAMPQPDTRRGMTCAESYDLPLLSDCIELYEYLYHRATLPGENVVKRYSKNVATTATTVELPAVYYVGRKEHPFEPYQPSTCQILFNAVPEREQIRDYDEIILRNVAVSVESITYRCLDRLHKKGFDHPGRYGTVYGYLIRTPLPGNSVNMSSVIDLGSGSNTTSASSRSRLFQAHVVTSSVSEVSNIKTSRA